MKLTKTIGLLVACMLSVSVAAQVSGFSLPNATKDGTVSLSDFDGKKAVVIVFTSNFCPYSKLYEDRLIQLYRDYEGQGIQLVLINPNTKYHPRYESLEAMQAKAKEKGYAFPYLADMDQKVTTMLGATKTPEAVVLKKVSGAYRIVYQGAIDDNPQVASDVHHTYLREVLDAIIAGKSTPGNQRPIGCMIKQG